MVTEVDGKVIANSELRAGTGYSQHVEEIGFGVKRGYRNVGVDIELMNALISHEKTMDFELLIPTTFSSNTRAIHVFERISYEETGRILPCLFKNKTYLGTIIMTKNYETNGRLR